jgi:phage baseplate assembly protein W
MPDMAQLWGEDLQVGGTGDLGVASGTILGQQRVLRRLLSNPGDYIWHPEYGAGLARFVGQTESGPQIRAVIRSQIFKETAVARVPEPVIDVQVAEDGTVYVHVRYVDAEDGLAQLLSFSVNA